MEKPLSPQDYEQALWKTSLCAAVGFEERRPWNEPSGEVGEILGLFPGHRRANLSSFPLVLGRVGRAFQRAFR